MERMHLRKKELNKNKLIKYFKSKKYENLGAGLICLLGVIMTIFCAIHFYNTSNIDILVTGLIITIGMIAFFTFIVYITKTIKYIKIISNIKNNNFRIEKNYAKEKYLSFGIPKVKLESRDIISISEQEFNKVKCENMHSIYYCVRVKPFEDEIFPFAANMYNLSPEYKDKLTNYIYNTKDINLP